MSTDFSQFAENYVKKSSFSTIDNNYVMHNNHMTTNNLTIL